MGENVEWIHLAQDMVLCLPTINTVTNPQLNKVNCISFGWC